MPGVFSSLAETAPETYNTVTSSQQESAASTDNESGPSGAHPTIEPMRNILAAVMRGAAAVQGQTQAKSIAKSQADGRAKMTVTMKQSPDGGAPLVTVKDAPADLLNGTQQDDLAKAYNTPKEQVEKKLSAAGAGSQPQQQASATTGAPTTKPPEDHPLEQAAAAIDSAKGYRIPRPWDSDIREKLKTEDGLRSIAEEMGLSDAKAEAHRAFKQLQKGVARPDAVAQRIADFRAHRIEQESQNLEAAVAPTQRAADRAQAEKDRQANIALSQQRLSDAERKQVLADKMSMRDKTDLSTIEPSKLRETMDAMNTTGVPFSEFEYRNFEQKQRQDVAKAFDDFKGSPDKYALGTYSSWQEAKAAFGHELTPDQDKQGYAAWKAAHTFAQRKASDDTAMQALREARLERIQQQIENATKEKPVPIGRSDLALMPAAELVRADPATVKNYDSALEQKEGLIRKEIRDYEEKKRKAAAQRAAIDAKPIKQFGDEEQRAGYDADWTAAMTRLRDAHAELDLVQTRRHGYAAAPLRATPPAVAPVQVAPKKAGEAKRTSPKIGDEKTFTAGPYAGKTGKWDGISYVIQRGGH